MKRKSALAMAGVLLSLAATSVLATACGGSGGIAEDPTKANITVATWDGGVGSAWLENAAKAFEEKYANATHFQEGRTGVKIHVDASRSYTGSGMENKILDKDIYFTEGINYYTLLYSGKIADLTDVMTKPLDDNTVIVDKISDNYANFLETDGKYYGIPFYDSFYSLAYDIDLWQQKGYYFDFDGNIGLKDPTDELVGYGPDGYTGVVDGIDYSADDGLPATYAEFAKLIKKMQDDSVTPFVWSEAGIEYFANYLYTHWAANEGYEQMMLNLTFDGTATSLIDVAEDGTVTALPETEITFANGYDLQKQKGKYDALRFMGEVLCSSANNYTQKSNHISAQSAFVRNGIEKDQPIGMIVEGSWWENEAKNAFAVLEKNDRQRHNYGILPTPRVDENSPLGQRTWLSLSSSYGVVSNSSKNKELAFEFMRFLHTDEQLSAFTAETSMTRALNYEVKEEDQANLTTYAKAILDIKKNGLVIYPYSDRSEVINNDSYFTAFNWAWQTDIGGVTHRNPFEYFKNEKNPKAITYFNGLYSNFKGKWKGEWKNS